MRKTCLLSKCSAANKQHQKNWEVVLVGRKGHSKLIWLWSVCSSQPQTPAVCWEAPLVQPCPTGTTTCLTCCSLPCLLFPLLVHWPSGYSVCFDSGRPGVWFLFSPWGLFWVELYQWFITGTPVATLPGAWWNWLAWCQYTVTGWDRKFGLQLLSQCGSMYNCLGTLRYTSMLLGC